MPAYGDLRIQSKVWNGTTYVVTDISNNPAWDWAFSMDTGQESWYDAPRPGSATLSATFTDATNQPGNISIGLIMDVSVYANAAWSTIFTGYVESIDVAYIASGVTANLVRMTLQLTGAMGALLNQTWYNSDASTQSTYAQVGRIFAAVNTQSWYEVDQTLTWAGTNPSIKWNQWDKNIQETIGQLTRAGSTTGFDCQIPVGIRNVWDDLVTLLAGCHGVMVETNAGNVVFYVNLTAAINYVTTFDASLIAPTLSTSASRTELRNSVDIVYTGATLTTSEVDSVQKYGPLNGSATTYLINPTDALSIGNYILGAYSSPTNDLRNISIEFLNPATEILFYPFFPGGSVKTTNLPASFGVGSSLTSTVCGVSLDISRDSMFYTFKTFGFSRWNASPTWQTIGAAYTWTSYGVAFPTTRWSDL